MDLNEQAVAARLGGGLGGGGPQKIPNAFRASFGMPILSTAAIVDSNGVASTLDNTCRVYDYPGVISRMRIIFGRRAPNGQMVYPTLPITDDGSTGSGTMPLIVFPKGVITINKVFTYVPTLFSINSAAWTCTTGIVSLGSAAAGTDATLTSTEQDILPASTLKLLTYSSNVPAVGSVMSASMTTLTLRSGVWTQATTNTSPAVLPPIVDNTGGTSGLTLANGSITAAGGTAASLLTGASILAATQNAHATEIAYINELIRRTQGLQGLRFDGTTTALTVNLNFACNSDPGAAQTMTLGYLTAGSETLQPPGYLDIDYMNCYGGTTAAVQDVAAPSHGLYGG